MNWGDWIRKNLLIQSQILHHLSLVQFGWSFQVQHLQSKIENVLRNFIFSWKMISQLALKSFKKTNSFVNRQLFGFSLGYTANILFFNFCGRFTLGNYLLQNRGLWIIFVRAAKNFSNFSKSKTSSRSCLKQKRRDFHISKTYWSYLKVRFKNLNIMVDIKVFNVFKGFLTELHLSLFISEPC